MTNDIKHIVDLSAAGAAVVSWTQINEIVSIIAGLLAIAWYTIRFIEWLTVKWRNRSR